MGVRMGPQTRSALAAHAQSFTSTQQGRRVHAIPPAPVVAIQISELAPATITASLHLPACLATVQATKESLPAWPESLHRRDGDRP